MEVRLVAVVDGGLIGTVTWCPLGSPWRQVAQQPHQGEFRMLAVAPAGRGHGVGRALVEACLERARTAGMTEVVMSSLPEMTTAHRLYGTFGSPAPRSSTSPPPPRLTSGPSAFRCSRTLLRMRH